MRNDEDSLPRPMPLLTARLHDYAPQLLVEKLQPLLRVPRWHQHLLNVEQI